GSGLAPEEGPAIPNVGSADAGGTISLQELGALFDPSLTWDDVGGFAAESGLPIVVKGVLTPEDARRAVDSGAAGIVVSNHGGRQLDTVLSGADALPAGDAQAGGAPHRLRPGGVRART